MRSAGSWASVGLVIILGVFTSREAFRGGTPGMKSSVIRVPGADAPSVDPAPTAPAGTRLQAVLEGLHPARSPPQTRRRALRQPAANRHGARGRSVSGGCALRGDGDRGGFGRPLAGRCAGAGQTRGLEFLGHWVGDVHQPLHVSFKDDRGGNAILEQGPCDNDLHAV